jgi:SHAQKYF class myb-like DNA-binding protein
MSTLEKQRRQPRAPKSEWFLWDHNSHDKFLWAVQMSGGCEKATPTILQHILETHPDGPIAGLLPRHIKSHLQRERRMQRASKGPPGSGGIVARPNCGSSRGHRQENGGLSAGGLEPSPASTFVNALAEARTEAEPHAAPSNPPRVVLPPSSVHQRGMHQNAAVVQEDLSPSTHVHQVLLPDFLNRSLPMQQLLPCERQSLNEKAARLAALQLSATSNLGGLHREVIKARKEFTETIEHLQSAIQATRIAQQRFKFSMQRLRVLFGERGDTSALKNCNL